MMMMANTFVDSNLAIQNYLMQFFLPAKKHNNACIHFQLSCKLLSIYSSLLSTSFKIPVITVGLRSL